MSVTMKPTARTRKLYRASLQVEAPQIQWTMAYEQMDDIALAALSIFNEAMIQTDLYIKNHRETFSKLNTTKEMVRREKLKEYLDFANSTIEKLTNDLIQDFYDQVAVGSIMGYLDDFYEELRMMTSEQLELFWGFHNPETSDIFWGNVESAKNLGKQARLIKLHSDSVC